MLTYDMWRKLLERCKNILCPATSAIMLRVVEYVGANFGHLNVDAELSHLSVLIKDVGQNTVVQVHPPTTKRPQIELTLSSRASELEQFCELEKYSGEMNEQFFAVLDRFVRLVVENSSAKPTVLAKKKY